jgi:hypothetical protein
MWGLLSWREPAPDAVARISATFFYASYQRGTRVALARWLQLADRVQSGPAGGRATFEALDCAAGEEERDMDEGLLLLPAVVVHGPGRSRHVFEGRLDFEALEDYLRAALKF